MQTGEPWEEDGVCVKIIENILAFSKILDDIYPEIVKATDRKPGGSMKCDAVYTGKTSFSMVRLLSRLFKKQFTNNGYQVVLANYKTLLQINLRSLNRNALLMIWSQVDEYFLALDFLKTEKFLLSEVFCWFRGKQTMYLFFGLRGKLNLNMDLFQHHVAVTRLPFVIGAPDPFRKTINVLTEKLKRVDLLSDKIISSWDTRKTIGSNNLFLAGC